MTNKKHLQKIVKEALGHSVSGGKLDEKKVINFVSIFKKLPTEKAIFTLKEYVKGLKQVINERTAFVDSAVELSENEERLVKKGFAQNLNFKFNTDSSLLGGVRVKIGDTVYDFSVRNRIRQVGEAIHG